MAPDHRLDDVQVESLETGVLYKVELFKDGYTEHAQIEDVEMGERYGTSFSLKIDITENDDEALANAVQKRKREKLPKSIDAVAKIKRSVQGLKESAFWLGNRSMVKLLASTKNA